MEGDRRAGDFDANQYRQRVSADLKRLQGLAIGQSSQYLWIIRAGYQRIGDKESERALLAKDTSYEGRMGFYAHDSQEWSANNPAPADDATVQTKITYWEKRLQKSDTWIKNVPENTFAWMDRLKSLSELKKHPETEFFAVAEKVLSLLRGGTGLIPLDFMKLAALYANRGVRLDQVPSLIREGYSAAQKRDLENANDLKSPAFDTGTGGFTPWQYEDDARHALFDAYLRIGETKRARSTLDEIRKGLAEWQMKVATVNNSYSLQIMTNELVTRERWLNDAQNRLTSKKQ
jgi:hypothetical protein